MVKGRGHDAQKTVPAWDFVLLWVLAFSSFPCQRACNHIRHFNLSKKDAEMALRQLGVLFDLVFEQTSTVSMSVKLHFVVSDVFNRVIPCPFVRYNAVIYDVYRL